MGGGVMKYLVNLKGKQVTIARFEAQIEIEANDEDEAVEIAESQTFEGPVNWTEDTDFRDERGIESGIEIVEAEVESEVE
jgi:hypothetical protein